MAVKIILILAVILILALLAVSIGLVEFVTKPKITTVENSIEDQKKSGLWDDFEQYNKEELNITSFDGYLLHGILLKNPGEKYVIVTHGYTDTRYGSLKYAHIYYRLGYNVYIYDLRHHGANKRIFCSMGKNESRDILAVTAYFRKNYGNEIQIGLHGESLGCASSIMALREREDYAFCVADCGFSDLKELLVYQGKTRLKLPPLFAQMAAWMCRVMYGYSFFEIRPIDTFLTNKTPVLFIHGTADDFIPARMTQDMYDACKAPKQLELFEGAGHASSYRSDTERYERVVGEFLKQDFTHKTK